MGRWTRGWKHNVAASAEWKHNLAIKIGLKMMICLQFRGCSAVVSARRDCAITVDMLHTHLTGGAVAVMISQSWKHIFAAAARIWVK